MRNILLTAVLAAGFAGCVGGIDSPDGTGGPGGTNNPPPGGSNDPGPTGGSNTPDPGTDPGKASKAAYDAKVDPIMRRQCISCHKEGSPLSANAPGFVSADATKGYAVAAASGALIGDLTPAGAPILSLIQTGHQNQQYTTDDRNSIVSWLALETAARKGGGGTQLDPVSKLENDWSACMTVADFTSANMIAWATVNTNDGNGNAQCQSCHNLGEYMFAANVVPQNGFDLISQSRIVMKQYFTVDSTTNPTKIIVNTTNLQSVATGTGAHQGHRRFNLANNQGAAAMTALTNFYNLTMAHVTAGGCGAPKFQVK